MADKSPVFSFNAGDWLGSVRIAAMSPEQEGAYIRLLAYAWGDPDCSIPDDDRTLASMSRLGERWRAGAAAIRECFDRHPSRPGRMYSKRLLIERQKQSEHKEQASTAKPEKPKRPSRKKPVVYPPAFETWWQLYPRRAGKQSAFTAWQRAIKRIQTRDAVSREQAQAVLDSAATDFAKSDLGKDQQYCPHPATWLNGGRWEDDRATWNRAPDEIKLRPLFDPFKETA
jgi:uncharacterized protein YdaU (DUF1376 family)